MTPAREISQEDFLKLRCQEIQKDIDALKVKANEASVLEQRLSALRHYEQAVQKMISVHPDLAEEWKNVERVYESLTGKPLMRTCDEKIFNRRDNNCTGCGSLPADRIERIRKRLSRDEDKKGQ